jgi:hypothetical protein
MVEIFTAEEYELILTGLEILDPDNEIDCIKKEDLIKKIYLLKL